MLYFSGWVRTVLYHDTGKGNCVLKAQVTPSQRLNDKPHEAWVGINKQTCAIITGHCTCMAGYVDLLIIYFYFHLIVYYVVAVKYVHMWLQFSSRLKPLFDWA